MFWSRNKKNTIHTLSTGTHNTIVVTYFVYKTKKILRKHLYISLTSYKSTLFNPLKTVNPLIGTLTNSVDPDKMLHTAISSGSALFAETKSIFRERNTICFGNYKFPSIYNGVNGPSLVYRIQPEGRIH